MEKTTNHGALAAAPDGPPDLHPLAYIAADLQHLAIPVTDLRPAPDNARKHADADLDALTASYRTFGQVRPFVGKRTYRGLRDVILCGNGGLAAALRLGWQYVAVAWLPETTTDDDARRLAVLDNRLAELSAWDPAALAALQADGVELLSLGWTGAELGDLLALADADAVPHFEPEPPTGRLDELEKHCATCRCREAK